MTPIERLQKQIDDVGGIRRAAAQLGISPSYLSDLMNGKRGVSVALAERAEEKMGIKALDLLKWQAAEDWRLYQERKRKQNERQWSK
ncbi:helix-turn-helix transcriptional regulator [Singulisphaera rosea]